MESPEMNSDRKASERRGEEVRRREAMNAIHCESSGQYSPAELIEKERLYKRRCERGEG